jgi:hypothetical protein
MAIPSEVLSERGNVSLTAEVLAQSLAECSYGPDDVPSLHELRGNVLHLGGGDSWGEALRAGMPAPVSMRGLCAWLVEAGWLAAQQVSERYR